jgi:hypothetical protein
MSRAIKGCRRHREAARSCTTLRSLGEAAAEASGLEGPARSGLIPTFGSPRGCADAYERDGRCARASPRHTLETARPRHPTGTPAGAAAAKSSQRIGAEVSRGRRVWCARQRSGEARRIPVFAGTGGAAPDRSSRRSSVADRRCGRAAARATPSGQNPARRSRGNANRCRDHREGGAKRRPADRSATPGCPSCGPCRRDWRRCPSPGTRSGRPAVSQASRRCA